LPFAARRDATFLCASAPNSLQDFATFSQGFNMKKLIIIAVVALSLLAGCVGWVHWGNRDNRNHQRQEQQSDRHDNRR
jgi:hypothetical protein